METIGKNIEIVPCAIREQRRERHYNVLKTTQLRRYCPAPGGLQKRPPFGGLFYAWMREVEIIGINVKKRLNC